MNIDFSVVKESKNLLAFSSGVDSTALFFLLLKQDIPFDIAIVNYNLRNQSKLEVDYAKELAFKYNKQIFIKDIKLQSTSNFEKKARDIRYLFFEEIIINNGYEVLITAHQLNDKLEWFMMQFCKGAGLVELLGFNEFEQRDNYKIYRPLINIAKNELLEFLENEKKRYFIDKSNFDEKYKRNFFRHNFCDELSQNFKDGILNSFKYLQNDSNSLNITKRPIIKIKDLEIFENSNDNNINIRIIDNNLKKRGILLTKSSREEIIKQNELTISHKINISITKKYIFIAPKSNIIMDKKFKEICRVNKIPKNIRAYLFQENIDIKNLIS